MANRFLGEISVEYAGEKYTLRCDFNAMCEFEDQTGENALAVFEQFDKGQISFRNMRYLMLAFMRWHHPDATLEQAGNLLADDIDNLSKVIIASRPSADEAADLGNGQGRKKAKAA
tara:strand:- start:25 stop:372 length:348 start_codon:yes stop_codon:yes gene_type:complete